MSNRWANTKICVWKRCKIETDIAYVKLALALVNYIIGPYEYAMPQRPATFSIDRAIGDIENKFLASK